MTDPLTPEEIRDEDERGIPLVSAVPLERYQRLRAALDEHDRRMQEQIARLMEERDASRARLDHCETCDGDGVMSVLVGDEPPDRREIYEPGTCGECLGTGIGSWGQALRETDNLRAELADVKRERDDWRARAEQAERERDAVVAEAERAYDASLLDAARLECAQEWKSPHKGGKEEE